MTLRSFGSDLASEKSPRRPNALGVTPNGSRKNSMVESPHKTTKSFLKENKPDLENIPHNNAVKSNKLEKGTPVINKKIGSKVNTKELSNLPSSIATINIQDDVEDGIKDETLVEKKRNGNQKNNDSVIDEKENELNAEDEVFIESNPDNLGEYHENIDERLGCKQDQELAAAAEKKGFKLNRSSSKLSRGFKKLGRYSTGNAHIHTKSTNSKSEDHMNIAEDQFEECPESAYSVPNTPVKTICETLVERCMADTVGTMHQLWNGGKHTQGRHIKVAVKDTPHESNGESHGIRRRLSLNKVKRRESLSKKPRVVYEDPINKPCNKQTEDKGFIEKAGLAFYQSLNKQEQKRQHAIYELIQTEENFAKDMENLVKFYLKPAVATKVFSEEEGELFTEIQSINRIHSKLVVALKKLQSENYYVSGVGETVKNWIANELLENQNTYKIYVSKIWKAKLLIDNRAEALQDLSARCRGLGEIRRLGIWDFVDMPRRRLQKYKVIFHEIRKNTTAQHTDIEPLAFASDQIGSFLKVLDTINGKAKTEQEIALLQKLVVFQLESYIVDLFKAGALIFEDVVRDKNCVQYKLFHFEKFFLVTRMRGSTFMVCAPPIYPHEISAVGEISVPETPKLTRRLSLGPRTPPSSLALEISHIRVLDNGELDNVRYIFYASDQHKKVQWLDMIQKLQKEHSLETEETKVTTESVGSTENSEITSHKLEEPSETSETSAAY